MQNFLCFLLIKSFSLRKKHLFHLSFLIQVLDLSFFSLIFYKMHMKLLCFKQYIFSKTSNFLFLNIVLLLLLHLPLVIEKTSASLKIHETSGFLNLLYLLHLKSKFHLSKKLFFISFNESL